MSRQQPRGFWQSLFGAAPPHDRFSLEELQFLHGVLLRNPVVNDANRDTVVEALRSIAELVIWGDQHDANMVEYFLTENLLAHFNQILQQRSNRRGNVAMQVLQTLSILIQNLRNQQTVYYLFSNNHINEIVSMRFDFEDDEVLGYFVNVLKTISLKLNEVTVQFFFQAGSSSSGGSGTPRSPGARARAGAVSASSGGGTAGCTFGRPASFPLYTESIKFVNHKDPMVRTAVKTLTLNVYGIPLPAVQQFVTSRPAATYFAELATYIAEQCQVLDRLLSSWDVSSPQAQGAVESCLAEVEDLLSYCNDVLMTGVPSLRDLLLECLWQAFVGPVLFWPLIQDDMAAQHIAALVLGGSGSGGGGGGPPPGGAGGGGSGSGWSLTDATAAGGGVAVQRGSVGPLCSLYVFERLFLAITDQQLLALLVTALLGGAACSSSGGGSPGSSRPGSPEPPPTQPLQQQQGGAAAAAGAAAAGGRWQIPQELLARLQYSPAAYRQAVLGMLRGTDSHVAAAAVRVLASLLKSRAVSEEQLELIGLLPQRRRKQRQLLRALVGDSPLSSQVLEPAAAVAAVAAAAAVESTRQQGDHSALAEAEQQQEQQQHGEQQQQQQRAAEGVLPVNGRPGSSRSGSGSSSRRTSSSSEGGRVELGLDEAADGTFAVRLQQVSSRLPARQQQQQHGAEQLSPQQQPQQQPGEVHSPPDVQQQQQQQQAPQQQSPSFQMLQQQQRRQQQQQAATAAAHAEQQFGEVVAALLGLLGSDLLPPLSLGTGGWLLHQLLVVGKGGALLSSQQRGAVAAAVARQQALLQQQLQGRWCDALVPMVAADWTRSRLAIMRAGPGSVHVAVQTWMQAVLVQELRWQQNTAAGGVDGPDVAAVAAKQAYLTVQAAVAVLQVQQVLLEGDIAAAPPCPSVTEADVRRGEVREQAQIGLSQRMHCSVCFSRGQERQVYFAVEGLPAHVMAEAADLSLLKPSVLHQVAAAAPVLLVADPGTKPETGLVLSVAPLLGADAAVDPRHKRWLHVQVRPPLRGLLKVLQSSHPGNVLLNFGKHLVSGHWVLSFPDGDRAASAQEHVEECAHKMRAVYCQLLHPLLRSSGGCEGAGGQPAAPDSGGDGVSLPAAVEGGADVGEEAAAPARAAAAVDDSRLGSPRLHSAAGSRWGSSAVPDADQPLSTGGAASSGSGSQAE